jgi:hypothetical protein
MPPACFNPFVENLPPAWEKLLDGRFNSKHPGRALWNLFADQPGRVWGALGLYVIKQSPASLLPLAVGMIVDTLTKGGPGAFRKILLTASEQLVQEALVRLTQGRTTLIVAHRFSTIRHAHRIVVLHGGQIAETGTQAELMARQGHFFRLAVLQAVTPEVTAGNGSHRG